MSSSDVPPEIAAAATALLAAHSRTSRLAARLTPPPSGPGALRGVSATDLAAWTEALADEDRLREAYERVCGMVGWPPTNT